MAVGHSPTECQFQCLVFLFIVIVVCSLSETFIELLLALMQALDCECVDMSDKPSDSSSRCWSSVCHSNQLSCTVSGVFGRGALVGPVYCRVALDSDRSRIWPDLGTRTESEPYLAGFRNSNLAGTGAGFG